MLHDEDATFPYAQEMDNMRSGNNTAQFSDNNKFLMNGRAQLPGMHHMP